jgi:hypothetical protein
MCGEAFMRQKGKRILLAFLNLLAFLCTIAVNALANILPLGGKTTGELSGTYPNLFVPAGITFAIWGVIYFLLAVFVIYQLLSAFRRSESVSGFIDRIGIFFILSCIANMGWIFAWHFQLVGISFILMVILLLSLISIYVRLEVRKRGLSWSERIGWAVPFSIYMGWITVATIANLTALLVNVGWGGFGLSPAFWTILAVTTSTVITLLIIFTKQDLFFSLVIEWAFVGIILKRISLGTSEFINIIIAVAVCMALIFAAMAAQLIRKQVY